MIRVLALIAVTGAVLVGGQSRPATQPERSASERRLPGGVQGTPLIQVTLDGLSRAALAQIDGSLELRGLQAPVTVTRDRWGVPHIVAQSTGDLYFAQGFVMAQDRLWQMEMWRRAAEGRLSEVLGPSALSRDRQARLLRYRGAADDEELKVYHPDARLIMTSYAAGVNAFIERASAAGALPVEFVLTGIRPEPWTIESLLLRQNSFGDATAELQLARSVAQLGATEANRRRAPDPFEELVVPQGVDVSIIGEEVLAATSAGRPAPRPTVLPEFAAITGATPGLQPELSVPEPGSNNWVISGALSATGKPIVANDPHREVALPSLRYIVHLSAPGWNVAGSSEPPFLGVAIGHNERIGWGLTIVGTDQHDVYVEELNPANEHEVMFNGKWEALRAVREEIRVKGAAPEHVEMKFSRHGPIFYTDKAKGRAYALRSALHQPGTAPYLAGLRLSQVRDCKSFLDAANYWNSPSENLICGDIEGNISWQASALTPSRKGWSGRLPVPGTGAYEWEGFRNDLPRELNPSRGFVATANNNIQPKGYTPLMFKAAPTPFERIERLLQLIKPGAKYTVEDSARWQHDALSLRAVADLPRFKGWTSSDPEIEAVRAEIAAWDGVYRRESRGAALYETWRTGAGEGGRGRGGRGQVPEGEEAAARPEQVEARLKSAVEALKKTQGADQSQWRWGRMHTRSFSHAFVPAFSLPTVERSGGAGTVAADGASYREIFDVANWDRSLVINTPGQSGQPGSTFYGNLLQEWADNKYFNLAFSKGAIEKAAAHRLTLTPAR
ncbi:MAG: penicillin acylase family protein [Acidobacteriota bacterium]|nr:penicillin acylase family protein [Acidobacteriota bacterium]